MTLSIPDPFKIGNKLKQSSPKEAGAERVEHIELSELVQRLAEAGFKKRQGVVNPNLLVFDFEKYSPVGLNKTFTFVNIDHSTGEIGGLVQEYKPSDDKRSPRSIMLKSVNYMSSPKKEIDEWLNKLFLSTGMTWKD